MLLLRSIGTPVLQNDSQCSRLKLCPSQAAATLPLLVLATAPFYHQMVYHQKASVHAYYGAWPSRHAAASWAHNAMLCAGAQGAEPEELGLTHRFVLEVPSARRPPGALSRCSCWGPSTSVCQALANTLLLLHAPLKTLELSVCRPILPKGHKMGWQRLSSPFSEVVKMEWIGWTMTSDRGCMHHTGWARRSPSAGAWSGWERPGRGGAQPYGGLRGLRGRRSWAPASSRTGHVAVPATAGGVATWRPAGPRWRRARCRAWPAAAGRRAAGGARWRRLCRERDMRRMT